MKTWLVGFVGGVLGGVITISWGIGLPALGLLALLAGAAAPPRPMGLGGTLVGLGVTWLALFGRIQVQCVHQPGALLANIAPDPNCGSDDLTPWLVVSAALLVAGATLSAAVLTRRLVKRG